MEKGFHLTVDGFEGSKQYLGDIETVYDFLDRVPTLIGMTKLMFPSVLRYNPRGQDDEWGVTGFIIVAESHISIHTYPARQYLALDIYSCKLFDLADAICYVKKLFNLGHVALNYLERGMGLRNMAGNINMEKILGKKALDREVRTP